MHTTALHPRFGVEVHGIDLRHVSCSDSSSEIRALFEQHSVLLFRNQQLDDQAHLAFAGLFGPLEMRAKGENKPAARVFPLSNVAISPNTAPDTATAKATAKDTAPNAAKDTAKTMDVLDEHDHTVQNLKANQFWHTDSSFLPVPAVANVLAAHVVSSTGGETQYVSSRAAFQDLDDDLKAQVRSAVLRHRYSHSRGQISQGLANADFVTMWEDQLWPAVWRNPKTGAEALYIGAHVCAVEGMTQADGQALHDALIAHTTRDGMVYSHKWRVGDVIAWDVRATLHRGMPWPYDQPRTLASVCVSATAADGLTEMLERRAA